MKLDSAEKILAYAIDKEQDAADFYTELAGKMDRPHMKDVFLGFAKEEMAHKEKLMGVRAGKRLISSDKKIQDLGIVDNLIEIDRDADLGYQDALIVAMKAEAAAFRLYNDLALATTDAELQDLFLALAHEEAKHKLRFETEYDEYILTEN